MAAIFSKKCKYGLQAVLSLSLYYEDGEVVPVDLIALELGSPKEFVSKILQQLTASGIILSKKGKSGGFALAKDPSKIFLIDIVNAIDGMDVFHGCVLGFPKCSTEKPCPLHDKWGVIRNETYEMLISETLEELKEKTFKKIKGVV